MSKKEIRLLVNPHAVAENHDDEDHETPPPPFVYSARLKLPFCLRCCSAVRHMVDMIGEHVDNNNSSNNGRQAAGGDEDTNNQDQNEKGVSVAEMLAATAASSSSVMNAPSFLAEIPSILPMEIPHAACSDSETLRLFCEYHAGNDHSRMELEHVANWGTDRETAQSLLPHASRYQPDQQRRAAAARRDPKRKYMYDRDGVQSSSSSDSDVDARLGGGFATIGGTGDAAKASAAAAAAANLREYQNEIKQFRRMAGKVEHVNLAAVALPDRNPAVILAATPQQGGILPSWERKWVLDNFLSLDSPACCAKAARVAALAEYMSCAPLIDLMALVIASRLCERHNPSTEHMQWCLLGCAAASSGFA